MLFIHIIGETERYENKQITELQKLYRRSNILSYTRIIILEQLNYGWSVDEKITKYWWQRYKIPRQTSYDLKGFSHEKFD